MYLHSASDRSVGYLLFMLRSVRHRLAESIYWTVSLGTWVNKVKTKGRVHNAPGPGRHGYISHSGMCSCAVWVCGTSGTELWAFSVPWLQAAPPLASAPMLAMAGTALAASIATMINATVRTKAMRLNVSLLLPLVLVRATSCLMSEKLLYLPLMATSSYRVGGLLLP